MGEYSKAAIIKYTRKNLGLTQEELAENICDPVTLSRYETGELNPSNDKFMRLMQKMGEREELFSLPIECETSNVQKTMDELLFAIEQRDWESSAKLLEIFKTNHKMSMEYAENVQYITRIEVIMKYAENKISPESAIEQLTSIFQLTFPNCLSEKFPVRRILRESEMLILFNIAVFYGETGKIEEALAIYDRFVEYFGRTDMVNDCKPRYLISLGHSNLLGNIGRYNESINVCLCEIGWLLKNNRANYLYNFYYNIGWNIKKKVEDNLEDTCELEKAKIYFWIAYQLCQLYPENTNNLKKIEKALEEMNFFM